MCVHTRTSNPRITQPAYTASCASNAVPTYILSSSVFIDYSPVMHLSCCFGRLATDRTRPDEMCLFACCSARSLYLPYQSGTRVVESITATGADDPTKQYQI